MINDSIYDGCCQDVQWKQYIDGKYRKVDQGTQKQTQSNVLNNNILESGFEF